MKLRTASGNNAKVQFPLWGTYEFTPECEIPDEFQGAIDHLLADGYVKVGVTAKEIHKVVAEAKKEEATKVEIPPKEEKGVESRFTCPDCKKECASLFGLQAHQRFCKK